MTDNKKKGAELVVRAFNASCLKKAVFSVPEDTALLRAVASPKLIGGKTVLQIETFHADNKVTHVNVTLNGGSQSEKLEALFGAYRRVNIITTAGDCEYRRSAAKGDVLLGAEKLSARISESVEKIAPGTNDKKKSHILGGNEPFLIALGISSADGRPHDKKLPKLRQINRFLEYVRDAEKHLPTDGTLNICDLCCGKSYLSFAIYHYFAIIKKRTVNMIGVDLKPDVISYCNEVAASVGFSGLSFVCGDVNEFEPPARPDLVVSLHACDTATDAVLGKGAEWQAPVILSTPCCHHYMNRHLNCPELAFIAEHSMLRQKFCDAATDALRAKKLEARGYSVEAVELVDPDDTPKNILLRAIKVGKTNERAKAEYAAAVRFLYGEEL